MHSFRICGGGSFVDREFQTDGAAAFTKAGSRCCKGLEEKIVTIAVKANSPLNLSVALFSKSVSSVHETAGKPSTKPLSTKPLLSLPIQTALH